MGKLCLNLSFSLEYGDWSGVGVCVCLHWFPKSFVFCFYFFSFQVGDNRCLEIYELKKREQSFKLCLTNVEPDCVICSHNLCAIDCSGQKLVHLKVKTVAITPFCRTQIEYILFVGWSFFDYASGATILSLFPINLVECHPKKRSNNHYRRLWWTQNWSTHTHTMKECLHFVIWAQKGFLSYSVCVCALVLRILEQSSKWTL